MNITLKTISTLLGIGIAALLLSNSVLANEQSASKSECSHSWGKEQNGEAGAYFDKRMFALHTALKLTASQEAAWTEFLNKIKPVKMEKPGHPDWKDLSTPDRLDRMLDNMKSHEQRMAEHAAAVRSFYDTLTPDQKKIFDHHFQEHHQRQDRHSHGKNNR